MELRPPGVELQREDLPYVALDVPRPSSSVWTGAHVGYKKLAWLRKPKDQLRNKDAIR